MKLLIWNKILSCLFCILEAIYSGIKLSIKPGIRNCISEEIRQVHLILPLMCSWCANICRTWFHLIFISVFESRYFDMYWNIREDRGETDTRRFDIRSEYYSNSFLHYRVHLLSRMTHYFVKSKISSISKSLTYHSLLRWLPYFVIFISLQKFIFDI